MPACLITLAHFRTSVCINAANAPGDTLGVGSAPSSTNRLRIVASFAGRTPNQNIGSHQRHMVRDQIHQRRAGALVRHVDHFFISAALLVSDAIAAVSV